MRRGSVCEGDGMSLKGERHRVRLEKWSGKPVRTAEASRD